jgi:hypothetical protein
MTARLSRPNAPAIPGVGLLAAGLALASLTELLILRTFTRTAIHIPGLQALKEPYEGLAFTGRYAYFVSVALLLVALPVLVSRLWAGRTTAGRIGAASVAFFAIGAALAALQAADRLVIDAVTASAVVMLAMAAAGRVELRATAPLLFAAAFALSAGHTLAQGAAQQGLGSGSADWMLHAAEIAGVAFAISTPLLVSRQPGRASLAAGGIVGLVTLAAFLGNGSTSRILLLWNEGLSGTLPAFAYAVAGGALAAAMVEALRLRRATLLIALLLLTTGGIGLHNTYQTGLVIAGLAILCLGAFEPQEAAQEVSNEQRDATAPGRA